MNILVTGSGAREHAIGISLKKSLMCDDLFFAPGNAGTAGIGTNLNIDSSDFETLAAACIENNITLIVPGSEKALVDGMVDFFNHRTDLNHILLVGPNSSAARLEGSKEFSKAFMMKYGIPTADALISSIENLEESEAFINQSTYPLVLKANGLAAGKGVVIALNASEAKATLHDMLGGKFGQAGSRVLLEKFLSGIEMSYFVATDGKSIIELPSAKDYKKIGDGETGPNTGGMGAVSPVPFATDEFNKKIWDKVVLPTFEGIKAEGINYKGFLFIGLMKVGDEPYVIEYNCRMGDPESEVIFPRIESDTVELMYAIASGELDKYHLKVKSDYAVTVVSVAEGYPEDIRKSDVISGVNNANKFAQVFMAGVVEKSGQFLTDGGRVIACTGMEKSLSLAAEMAYQATYCITWQGKYFRTDIGNDLRKFL